MFITGGRRRKVALKSILKFVTGTEKEPLLGLRLHPSFFTCINRLNLPRKRQSAIFPMKKLYFIYMIRYF